MCKGWELFGEEKKAEGYVEGREEGVNLLASAIQTLRDSEEKTIESLLTRGFDKNIAEKAYAIVFPC